MRLNSILFGVAISAMVLASTSVFATDFNVSSGASIDISTPGNHTITGSGSSTITITGSQSGAVFNITLNNMTLTASDWASAINLSNASAGTMTVNFILIGVNSTTGYNHGGIQATQGSVNVVFTTNTVAPGTASLTSTAVYFDSNAFRNNGGTMYPSIDPMVNCTALLDGASVVDNNQALADAFNTKPLVLTLKKVSTANETLKSGILKVKDAIDGVTIEGLELGERYKVYNMAGVCVANDVAKSEVESVKLTKGIFILKTSGLQMKFVK